MIYPDVKTLANGKNFAAFTTLLPGGQPMTHVMWVDADDAHILINSEMGRQKVRNVTKDPRVTVTIVDSANPYHYAEVRGLVVEQVRGPRARAHIDELSEKYTDRPYDPAAIKTERVLLVIAPERQRVNG
ncbi:MAG TPA: TIGR03618 family F420-dependent PPOX class oxidoreductase [Acidimicrobiales bacterium]|nr:TIGR03618 family F420-dependent PPOX class oxidoreductase [Acidimicrobiales bacterium]